MFLLNMFSRRWLFATLFVFAGTALCVRLGIWQLDRLEGRRADNAHISAMWAMDALDLNSNIAQDIEEMEYRSVQVSGEYDFENQVALRNKYYGDQVGYHLLTPLVFKGMAVIVDRGWIPADGNSAPSDWRKYDEPVQVNISGQIRLEQTKPAFGGVADAVPENGARLEIWNNADITRIASQLPYPVLPVLIQPDVYENDAEPPITYQPVIELTEGSHFGYALQWFTFATILFVGYPFYLRKQEKQPK
jgi:surfeit locus 1 family protein